MTDQLTSLDLDTTDDSTPLAAVSTDASDYGRATSSHPVYTTKQLPEDRIDELEGDTSDDVDPRRLVREPTASEIRWYYRNSPFAPTIVDKPVDDAFKNGFDVDAPARSAVETLVDDWQNARRDARKAARRDGFAFIFFQYNDNTDASRPPTDVSSVHGFEVLDIGELESDPNTDGLSERTIAENVEYDHQQLRTLPQGVVVVEDITSPDHHDIVGVIKEVPTEDATRQANYGEEYATHRFLHADRLQHFVENPTVDGPLDENWVGEVTGHPVLGPVFHELKGLAKTSWAVGQTLYRHSAPLHVVEIEEALVDAIDDTEEHISQINDQTRNVNAASSISLPPGHSMKAISGGGEIEPGQYVETLIEMLCAGVEMTKSVLMGIAAGTVSGAESDIKNYFNQVQRYRQGRAVDKLREAVDMVRVAGDGDIIPNTVGDGARKVTVDYGPLFKIDELDTTEAMTRVMTAVTNGTTNYVLSLDDAQSIVEEAWADLGVDVDLDELSEDEKDALDRVNATISQRNLQEQEAGEFEGNPRVGQNSGGVEQGETQESRNPATDAIGALDGAIE